MTIEILKDGLAELDKSALLQIADCMHKTLEIAQSYVDDISKQIALVKSEEYDTCRQLEAYCRAAVKLIG